MKLGTRLVLDALQTFAASGHTIEETAEAVGLSYPAVSRYARRYGLKFIRGGLTRNDERSIEMASLYKSGRTLNEIGQKFELTRERVRQIISKHHGLNAKHGGKSVIAKKRRIIKQAKRDESAIKRCGCTFSQYALLRQMRKPTRAFSEQKRNARTRGIEWKLNLWQWWTIWQESGHWDSRGRNNGEYVMCRFGDSGPYSVDNVYIATCNQNIQDYYSFSRQEAAA